MKQYFVLFREPDGRQPSYDATFTQQHNQHWRDWLTHYRQQGKLLGGQSLTLDGLILLNATDPAQAGPHQVGTELVGGYLLLQAADWAEAQNIVRQCLIFEAGGYAEIREITAPTN